LELEALLGSVIELAQVVGGNTPVLKAVYALTRMLERQVLAKGHGLTL
jgi:ketopantoate reductase